jgi:glycosyltransferase involved in cell wall biosynthesis
MPPKFSIVAPIYNEQEIVPEFYRRLTAVMEGLGEPYEIILINDGSRDNSLAQMHALHRQDPHVKVINFARNFGHQISITAGMDYAAGEAVVVIDSDLQDPPEVIPELVAKWREGYEVVYAVRAKRIGETWFKKWTAHLFYRLIQRIANVDMPVDTGDFRLMDRKVLDVLRGMREVHRLMRGMAAWVGFRQTGVPYERQARFAGETKYPLKKMLRLTLDAITSFSYFPLQLATYAGFLVAALSALFIIFVIAARLSGTQAFEGQATTLIAVLFLGSLQLLSLGVLGEYLGRVTEEVKRRPLYIVANAWGLEGGPMPAARQRPGTAAWPQINGILDATLESEPAPAVDGVRQLEHR